MMLEGIALGLTAAGCQSAGYIASRMYVKKGGSALGLLLYSQCMMALASLPLLPFFWKTGFWREPGFWLPFAGVTLGSLSGQFFFFRAGRDIAPSRMASLMGLRIVTLAAVSALLGLERYNFLQCGGIALAVFAALVINYDHGRFKLAGMNSFAVCLACYCVSDLSVSHMIHALYDSSLFQASLLGAALVNITSGLLLISLLGKVRGEPRTAAAPYAGVWFAKQIFLYSCYALIGPVFGNVVMSARGAISIGITLVLLHLGVRDLETPKPLSVWIRRGIATLLMAGAIVIYSFA